MTAALLSIALLSTPYRSTLIYKLTYDGGYPGRVVGTVLTDQNMVAGFVCDMVGIHSELFAGKPFVWIKGKFVRLPLLPRAEYGHVFDGNDQCLVGSVRVDYRERPVQWTPDPFSGWAKPRITQISTTEGQATHLAPDGSIWIHYDGGVIGKVTGGFWQRVSLGPFQLAGFDRQGRKYGNRFHGHYEGGRIAPIQAGVFTGVAWRPLAVVEPTDNWPAGVVTAVNSEGVAVGKCLNQLAIWNEGKVSLPLPGKHRWSYATAINEFGAVLGSASLEDVDKTLVFLYKEGKITDLAKSVPNVQLEEGQRINRHGSILVEGSVNREDRYLYLLQPR